jgi:hypothetical protein
MPLVIKVECEFESKAWTWAVDDDGMLLAGASRTLEEAISQVVDAAKTIGESYGRTDGLPNRHDLVHCNDFEGAGVSYRKVPIQVPALLVQAAAPR